MLRLLAVTLLTLAIANELPRTEAGSTEPTAATGVEITYLANEGFLLAAGEKKVLIDALFPGITNYPAVPEPIRSRLERAETPFDGVDLVLATENGVMGPFEIETDGEGFLDIFLPTGPISDGAGCPPPNPSSGASARPTGVVIVVHRSTGSVTLTFDVIPQLDDLATWEIDLGTFQVESG